MVKLTKATDKNSIVAKDVVDYCKLVFGQDITPDDIEASSLVTNRNFTSIFKDAQKISADTFKLKKPDLFKDNAGEFIANTDGLKISISPYSYDIDDTISPRLIGMGHIINTTYNFSGPKQSEPKITFLSFIGGNKDKLNSIFNQYKKEDIIYRLGIYEKGGNNSSREVLSASNIWDLIIEFIKNPDNKNLPWQFHINVTLGGHIYSLASIASFSTNSDLISGSTFQSSQLYGGYRTRVKETRNPKISVREYLNAVTQYNNILSEFRDMLKSTDIEEQNERVFLKDII